MESRFLCADIVRVDWLDAENNSRSEQALLEDISSMGGSVQLEEPIPLGTVMMLTVATTPFFGYVCYCTVQDGGFFVGLRFSNDTTWSAGLVRPQHLTNVQQLARDACEGN
jgi:hypothetical protein